MGDGQSVSLGWSGFGWGCAGGGGLSFARRGLRRARFGVGMVALVGVLGCRKASVTAGTGGAVDFGPASKTNIGTTVAPSCCRARWTPVMVMTWGAVEVDRSWRRRLGRGRRRYDGAGPVGLCVE